VLAAIGLPERLARGNVLLSFGMENTEAEVDQFTRIFANTVQALREMSPEWDDFQRGLIQPILPRESKV
jgi:cysteine desulfurase